MGLKYKYVNNVKIADLLLDAENPRFASSTLVESTGVISQEAIIEHLLRHSDVISLANRINAVEELHGSELITCYEKNGKYTVIEGNRRTCACKLLLNRELIPEEYKSDFPVITKETKGNIEEITINLYPDRESVQAYLSDRHIKGIKTWSALEKNNYYMNLFNQLNDINEVTKYTPDSKSTIRNCIIKYQFFMEVFNTLKTQFKDIAIEKIDYLPLVNRFMKTLLGNDEKVGLNIELNESDLKYLCPPDKKDLYTKILLLIGEAFLIRKESNKCIEGELPKIVSVELNDVGTQKDLIINDERIPGLYELIKEYKGYKDSNNSTNEESSHNPSEESEGLGVEDGEASSEGSKEGSSEDNTDVGEASDKDPGSDSAETEKGESEKFYPNFKPRNKKTQVEYLCFTTYEASKFKINGDSNFEVKIRSIINDMASFSVYKHPCTCALLYRTLLECAAKLVFQRYSHEIKHNYKDDELATNLIFLNDNYLFRNVTDKEISKNRTLIKDRLTTTNIINTLNQYIHQGNQVDEGILLSSWNTMKIFIKMCLEK